MTELLDTIASWPSLLLVILVFGFAPGFCLRLLVLTYPRSDPRRSELIAELYTVPRIQRPLWVAEQLETALFEGLLHRLSAVLRWITHRRQTRAKTGPVLRAVSLAVLNTVFAGGFLLWTALVIEHVPWFLDVARGMVVGTSVIMWWAYIAQLGTYVTARDDFSSSGVGRGGWRTGSLQAF